MDIQTHGILFFTIVSSYFCPPLTGAGVSFPVDEQAYRRNSWLLAQPLEQAQKLKEVKDLALQGDAHAQALMAYYHGNRHEWKKMWEWARKSANQGNVYAEQLMGTMSADLLDDWQTAVAWWKKAAQKGDPVSLSNLGIAYYQGKGAQQNDDKAFYFLNQAAHDGAREAQYLLGSCYFFGKGVEKNEETALNWWKKAAENGSMDARYTYGSHIIKFQARTEEGLHWLELAAEQGQTLAMDNLFQIYLNGLAAISGRGYVPKDEGKAWKWCFKAATMGDPKGMANMAGLYWAGRIVPQDYHQAFIWLSKAAESELPEVLHHLAILYYQGAGVEKDIPKAIEYLQRAAERGSAQAQYQLAVFYEQGLHVDQDVRQAMRLYAQSAELGDSNAQYQLGLRYYHGQGVKKDIPLAIKWIQKAADGGNLGAIEALKEYASLPCQREE